MYICRYLRSKSTGTKFKPKMECSLNNKRDRKDSKFFEVVYGIIKYKTAKINNK